MVVYTDQGLELRHVNRAIWTTTTTCLVAAVSKWFASIFLDIKLRETMESWINLRVWQGGGLGGLAYNLAEMKARRGSRGDLFLSVQNNTIHAVIAHGTDSWFPLMRYRKKTRWNNDQVHSFGCTGHSLFPSRTNESNHCHKQRESNYATG